MRYKNSKEEVLYRVGFWFVLIIVGLIVAFPIKWCWNYAIVSLFAAPVITWGKAWCLYYLLKVLVTPSLILIKENKNAKAIELLETIERIEKAKKEGKK